MPLRVERTPLALEDLLDIWDYIAADSEAAADRLLERIGRSIERLAQQPLAGRARNELQVPNIRSLAVARYIIFYTVSETTVTVVRVLEGHRDIEANFRE